jgi:hypothetical protein
MKLTLFITAATFCTEDEGETVFCMKNHKIYIAAGLILFGLMGACAPTKSKPAVSSNMDSA